jgi:RHS repeat-associated protein
VPDEPIVHDFQSIQNAFATVQQFGEQIKKLGTTLTGVHESLAEHCSGDESGVGAVVAGAAKDVTGVAGKVFTEGGRVLSEMGTRGKTNGQRTENTDRAIADTFNGVHDEHYGGGTGSGGSEPGGSRRTGSGEPGSTGDGGLPGGGGPGDSEGNGRRCTGGDPVDVVSGQMVTSAADLGLPGLLPLVLRRAYASSYAGGRLFGPGWSSTLDQRVVVDDDGIHYAGDDAQILHYPMPTQPGQRVLPAHGARWPLTWDRAADEIRIEDDESGWTRLFSTVGASRDGQYETRPLTALSDRHGHRITYISDEGGIPVEVRHSGGYRVAVDTVYTSAGFRVESLRLLDGSDDGRGTRVIGYEYDPRGRLAGVVNSSGLPYVFEYDDADRISAWIDRTGFRYDYRYDDAGRVVRGTGEGGHLSATFDYDPDNRVTVVTNSLGHRTEYRYDQNQHVIKIVNPLGNANAIEYDRYGRLLSFTDPLGNVTRYTRDGQGDPIGIENPDGTRVSVAYDERWRLPTRIEQPGGAVWQHTYSESGSLLTTTDPLGAVTANRVDDRGHLVAAVEPDGEQWAFESDAAGRPLSVTSPLGATSRYELDVFGRVVAMTDPLGLTTRFGWTVEGLLAWQSDPDGGRREFVYDAEGQPLECRDPAGGVTRFEPGPFSTMAARTGPDGLRYTFAHDTERQLRKVTGPTGLTWEYEYDAAGNLVSETDFAGRTVSYGYDAAGRRTGRAGQSGSAVAFERDRMGRVVAWRVEDGRDLEFEYDAGGWLARAGDGLCELTYRRDLLGRPLAEEVDGRAVVSEYDLRGRRTRRVTASGVESVWQYTPMRHEASLTGTAGTLTFEYDLVGQETARYLGTGAALTQTYDQVGRLIGQGVWAYRPPPADPEGESLYQAVQQRTYTYRADGIVSAVGDLLRGARAYELTAAGRVAAVTGATWTERYAYDELGNLASSEPGRESEESGARVHDGVLLRTAGRTSYEYDDHGRLVRSIRRTLSGQRREWTYTWDALGRLAALTTPDGASWQYAYDPLGRRIAKRRLDPADGAVLERVSFLWDGSDLAEQHREAADGAAVDVTTWDYRGGTVRPVAQTTRSWLADASDEVVDSRFYAIVTDLIGAPAELVTPDGRIAWYRTADLWGGPLAVEAEEGAHCPLRFPGQYQDAESGLHYNFYRYYDPGTARFLSPDPLGLPAAPNNYAYVENPVTFSDPLGLASVRGPDGRYERDPLSPPTGHNRDTEYPHDYWPSTHDYMVRNFTTQGQAAGAWPVDSHGVKIPRENLSWVDGSGNPIPFKDLTYDHNPAVVQHWIDEGYDQSQAQREAWYNKTDGMEAMTRSENSSKGARLGLKYSDKAPGPNYTC